MDDLTRIFGGGKCDCPECRSAGIPDDFDAESPGDPDPGTDYALPGDVRFGSRRWNEMISALADDRLDFTLSDPEDADEFLSESDILDDDRPTWEDIEAWEEATRGEPTAAELALAIAEIRRGEDQQNGYFAILDETPFDETDRWFNREVEEF